MRIKLSQLRRIIKEEASRFITESYSGEPPVLPRDYAIDKAAVRGSRAYNEDMSELVPSECPDCGAPLEGGEDGSAGCNECGWTEDDVRPLDPYSGL